MPGKSKHKHAASVGIPVPPAWLAIPRTLEIYAEWDAGRVRNVLKVSRNKARVEFHTERQSNARAIDEFLRLAKSLESGETKAVIAFAKKWGVLNLCQHQLPYTHVKRPGEARCEPSNKEPLEVWRRFVNEALEALTTAVKLPQHRAPLLNRLEQETTGSERRLLLAGIANEQAETALRTVHEWLQASGLMLFPNYAYGSGFNLSFEHGGRLFDLLTAQLLMAVAGAAALGLCAACGRLFRLGRKRKPGQRAFCPLSACHKAAAAKWVQEFRSRARDSNHSTGGNGSAIKAVARRKSVTASQAEAGTAHARASNPESRNHKGA